MSTAHISVYTKLFTTLYNVYKTLYTNLYNGDDRIYKSMSTLNSLPHFTMSTKLSTQISTIVMIELSIEQSTLLSV